MTYELYIPNHGCMRDLSAEEAVALRRFFRAQHYDAHIRPQQMTR